MLSNLSDQELIERVRARDHEAMAMLYDRYSRAVYSLALHVLREQRAAEDIVQDVFLTFWQRPTTYIPERGAFGPWILRVARNRAIDLLRRGSREHTKDGDREFSLEQQIVDPEPEPDDLVWHRAVAERVREAITELTGPQRQVIELAYFGGMTQSEIAAYLDTPLGTIKTRVRTALSRLAKIMAEEEVWTDVG
ncbi:sigma-70 family RNA polymerase sigma factor [Nitrolancea hollandica]|uniref:RNA polymerase, sigma-24 subunit, ECF subfamily n=1 Tax=Nitrolancea hollandica Lb TaxID=1129897 RepID=I4EGN7_9BACT|nr:sigma-70 family RNA polymerase sigma factor [Nitrolancea hollandica]CCF83849.1 RNA polymerase, sigma-24 subunit, ECF subfamily [Nitrolancea hollandica Lb]